MWEAFPFADGEVGCVKTAVSFVDSVWETVGPLLQGVPSVIVPQEVVVDPGRFVELLATHRVSRIVLVPSFLRTLLEVVPDLRRRLPRLAYWTSSGEALPTDLARRFRTALPNATLLNLYGSSEVAADVTCYALGATDPLPEGVSVPIGRPIRNTQVYLLDEDRRPVAPGQEGELYVGGVQLSPGYLHRPDLTGERFVEDTRLGGRLYRTGDRARQLADGNLEFVGRADQQVKIRGVRIEPGEIEAALRGLPGVSDAAVVAGDSQLVAYVVGGTLSGAELRGALSEKLPPHLVPARFVFLDALPRTPSGKVARNLLPPVVREASEPPVLPRESELAEIWAEVLGCDSVGCGDDFFELGGDSLRAAVLAARLDQFAGRKVSLRFVYENPTLAGCAAALESGADGGPAACGALIERMDRDAHLDPAIVPASPAGPTSREGVFLTGATGFLGAFLLHEIAGAYDGPIDCLVRAPTVEVGQQRIREQLARFGIPAARIEPKLGVVTGDLALPRFGLSGEAFEGLARRTDVLFHCGAAVHFYHNYEHLCDANVGGTREVIRLACAGRVKPIHYVSTLAAVDTHASAGGHVTESWCPAPQDPPLTGYAQSKWVGERLLAQAGERGVPVAVYRCDDISGHSRSGAWNRTDFLWQWVRACAALGRAPDVEMPLYMIPVDAVSRAVVGIARHRSACGETFHLRNPRPCSWRDLLDGLAACGHPLERIPYEAWRREVARRAAEGDEVFTGIAPVFTECLPGGKGTLLEYAFAGHRPTYDDTNTARALAVAGLRLAPVDGPQIAVYARALRRSGFLPRPARSRPSPAGVSCAGAADRCR
jgi:thioester reductase-like protein